MNILSRQFIAFALACIVACSSNAQTPAKSLREILKDLGLSPSIFVGFNLISDDPNASFLVKLQFENRSSKEIVNWSSGKTPLGLIMMELDKIESDKTIKVLDAAKYKTIVAEDTVKRNASSHKENAQPVDDALLAGEIAQLGSFIQMFSKSNPPSVPAGLGNAHTPFSIDLDGDYRIRFMSENSDELVASIEFSVRGMDQDKTHVIIRKMNDPMDDILTTPLKK